MVALLHEKKVRSSLMLQSIFCASLDVCCLSLLFDFWPLCRRTRKYIDEILKFATHLELKAAVERALQCAFELFGSHCIART